jgi:predicted DNA-binding transcriptional regulator AlpA
MEAELNYTKKMQWLREMLDSGEAWRIVSKARLGTPEVARLIGVSQSSAWAHLNGRQFPRRRTTAMRLAWLLENLQAGQDG